MTFPVDALAVIRNHHRQSAAGQTPCCTSPPLGQVIAGLDLERYAREGGLCGLALDTFLERYFITTNHLHHPGFTDYQVAVPHYAGALGSLIDSLTGNSMAIYETGPGATAIEYFVINWMLEKIGWCAGRTGRKARHDQLRTAQPGAVSWFLPGGSKAAEAQPEKGILTPSTTP